MGCPTGKGTCLIILEAGGEMGWVPDTTLIFRSENTGNYHNEMIADHFEEWFLRDCFQMSHPIVIIMDNASYQSRQGEEIPTKSWAKKKMIEWLEVKGVPFPPKVLKSKIFIIQRLGVTPQYKVDEMALAAGHKVVCLPVAYCTLNHIELGIQ